MLLVVLTARYRLRAVENRVVLANKLMVGGSVHVGDVLVLKHASVDFINIVFEIFRGLAI